MWFYLFGKTERRPEGGKTHSNCPAEPPARPLDRLTSALDEAWDAGRLTPEAIDAAVRRFREVHPHAT